MRKHGKGGSIVSISSTRSLQSEANGGEGYSASKGGINSLTQALAVRGKETETETEK